MVRGRMVGKCERERSGEEEKREKGGGVLVPERGIGSVKVEGGLLEVHRSLGGEVSEGEECGRERDLDGVGIYRMRRYKKKGGGMMRMVYR